MLWSADPEANTPFTFKVFSNQRLLALQDTTAELASLSDARFLHGLLSAQQRVSSEPGQQSTPSLQTSLQLVSDGIQASAALMAQAVQPATAAVQRRHVVELQAWFADSFPACTLSTISPELLAVYLTQQWLPRYAGSQLPASEDRIAAPASLAAMLSHLSSNLEHVEGRVGPYQLLPEDLQQGNPVHSSVIPRLRKGYSNDMRSKGVSQGAAAPVSFDQVQQLLQSMEAALQDSEPHTAAAVMMARDGFLISTLWHTVLRGDNAGRLCTSDVIFSDGSSVSDFLASGADDQPGSQLFFRPDGTKTLRAANGGRVPVDVLSSDEQHLCCIWWLQQLQLEHTAFANQPLSGYLSRPLTPCRSRFADKPMSSSSINVMLKMRQLQFNVPGDIAWLSAWPPAAGQHWLQPFSHHSACLEQDRGHHSASVPES
jgi:hypothetical protein